MKTNSNLSSSELEKYLEYLGEKRKLNELEAWGKDVNGEPVKFYGDGYDDARFLGLLRGKAEFEAE